MSTATTYREPTCEVHTVVVPASDELVEFVRYLGSRADAIRGGMVAKVRSTSSGAEVVDNMLCITGDGRKAALDLRLVNIEQPARGKIAIAAENIATLYHEHINDRFNASSRLGALQLVFCDLGTPKNTWNAYDELREHLCDLGIPRNAIRFIHEAKNDAAKASLFNECREGTVSVLIGSTERMGTGMNVQTRCIALHHLDCPWRPADLEQREGRIVRQGNCYEQVHIYRYAVEGSFDVYMWQTVERKAKFLAQVLRGAGVTREAEDVDAQVLSYGEVKALAAGNPLMAEKVEVDAKFAQLERARQAWLREQRAIGSSLLGWQETVERSQKQIASARGAFEMMREGEGVMFDGAQVEKPGDELARRITEIINAHSNEGHVVCSINGLDVVARCRWIHGEPSHVVLSLATCSWCESLIEHVRILSPGGLIHRVESLITRLDDSYKRICSVLNNAENRVEAMSDAGDNVWPKEAEYQKAKERRDEIAARIEQAAEVE